MKKFYIFFAMQLILMSTLCTTAAAAEIPRISSDNPFVIMSSPYIKSYSTTITTNPNGIIALDCTVIGTGIMDVIGVKSIQLQKYVSGSWTDVKNWSDIYNYNSIQANTYSTYQGTAGSRYRAVVTFYAENEDGYDTRVVTTNSVTAEN